MRPGSRQAASTSVPSMRTFVSGFGSACVSMKARNLASSSLRVELRAFRRRVRTWAHRGWWRSTSSSIGAGLVSRSASASLIARVGGGSSSRARFGERDVDPGAGRRADAPEGGGGVVAEHGARAGGEDGGHPASALREGSVADGVHAAVHDVESLAVHPPVDRAPSHAALEQLPAGHDPMLRACQVRNEGVDGSRLRFAIHVMVKCRVDRHRPILALRSCRVRRGSLQTCGAFAR
jgi:hypothetical protein